MNSLIAALPWPRAMRMHSPSHALVVPDITLDAAAEPATRDDAFCACGWFDSSLDLAGGLQVIEHAEWLLDDVSIVALH